MRFPWRWVFVWLVAGAACAELRSGSLESDAGAETESDADSPEAASIDASTDASTDGRSARDTSSAGDALLDSSVPRVVEVLVSGLIHPLELARSGDTLFYTVKNDPAAQVRKVKVDGGAPSVLVAFDAAGGQSSLANDLAFVGSDVFWANGTAGAGSINAVPMAGGGTRMIGGYVDTPYRLAAFAGEIFYVDRGAKAALRRVPATGGTAIAVAEYQIRVGGVAVDSSGVYWTQGGPLFNGKNGVRTNALGALPDAASDLHVGSDNGDVGGVALSATDVFWAETEGGRVLRVGKTGGLVSVLADGLDLPVRLVLDGGFVYFTELGGTSAATGTVRRVRESGGTVETLASAQDHPHGIAVDATHVFWTSYEAGEILRVRK